MSEVAAKHALLDEAKAFLKSVEGVAEHVLEAFEDFIGIKKAEVTAAADAPVAPDVPETLPADTEVPDAAPADVAPVAETAPVDATPVVDAAPAAADNASPQADEAAPAAQ